MKMKMKMTMLAGALALSVAGQAGAAILGNSTTPGGADLILNVWDTTSATSYTLDLGISLASYVAGTATVPTSWTADANFTSFLAGATASTTVWNVAGMASGTAFSAYNFLTTASSTPGSMSNGVVKSFNSSTDPFMTAVATAAGTANSVVVANATNPTAYAGGVGNWSNNFGGKATFSNVAGYGQSLNFYSIKPSSASGIAASTISQFANTTFTLASNGTLSYAGVGAVAAVPEPGEWLLMLSGLALIGFIATRRRNNEGSMTFA